MDQKEKTMIPSVFIAEIKNSEDEELKITSVDDNKTIAYTAELMKFAQGEAKLIDDEWIESILENFKISATSLNKYLKCKLTFYFENILRVPLARSVAMGYGNAVHYSLEQFFLDINRSSPRSYPSVNKLLEYFVKGMEKYRSHFTPKEFENYTKNGEIHLKAYYETYQKEWLTPLDYKVEYNIPLTEYHDVPISGKLDRVNIYNHHISVTDYKTGSYQSYKVQPPSDKNPDGGDYWRQIMFYRLLLDGDKKHNWNMREGTIDFVEMDQDKFIQKSFAITQEYLDIVGSQLVESYQQIKAHVFTPGCGEDDCKWCNFVARNMPVSSLVSDDEIDISRGDMLVKADDSVSYTNQLTAHLVWMAESPLQPGKEYLFKFATKVTLGSVERIHHRVDVNELQFQPAERMQLNDIAKVDVGLQQPVVVDNYQRNRGTGAFIVIDRLTNVTVGAGMVEEARAFSATAAPSSFSEFELELNSLIRKHFPHWEAKDLSQFKK
mgnify:CR=1 FL=1